MPSFEILVDDRERFVLDEFATMTVPHDTAVVQRRLSAGDFAITYRGRVLFLLERKTWADLAATIRDASRRNNYKLLVEHRESNPRATVGYLIEGAAFPDPKQGVGQMTYGALIAHLDHRVVEDRFAVFHTRSPRATAERLLVLLKNYQSLKTNAIAAINAEEDLPQQAETDDQDDVKTDGADKDDVKTDDASAKTAKGGAAALSRPRHKSDSQARYEMLCMFPGVTEMTAALLTDARVSDRKSVV